MNLFSKILNIYLLFNILKKFGGPQPPLLVHDFIPAWRWRLSVNSKWTVIIIKKAGFLTTSLGWWVTTFWFSPTSFSCSFPYKFSHISRSCTFQVLQKNMTCFNPFFSRVHWKWLKQMLKTSALIKVGLIFLQCAFKPLK